MNISSFLRSLTAHRDNSYSFSRLGPDGEIIQLPGGSSKSPPVLLITPKSLSIRSFDLPTSSKAQIRKILAANLLPYDIHSDLATFPCIIHKSGNSRSSQGIAFCTTTESLPDVGGAFRCWPAALILAGGLSSGSGVTIWQDEAGISSMLWEDWTPVLVRYNPGSDVDAVVNWYKDWNSRRNMAAPEICIYSTLTPDLFGELQEKAGEEPEFKEVAVVVSGKDYKEVDKSKGGGLRCPPVSPDDARQRPTGSQGLRYPPCCHRPG